MTPNRPIPGHVLLVVTSHSATAGCCSGMAAAAAAAAAGHDVSQFVVGGRRVARSPRHYRRKAIGWPLRLGQRPPVDQ